MAYDISLRLKARPITLIDASAVEVLSLAQAEHPLICRALAEGNSPLSTIPIVDKRRRR